MTAHEQSFWDQRYSQDDYWYGYRPNDFLREAAMLLPKGGRVLVLCDGEGRNGVWLAQQGYQVTSVDLSPVAVKKALALAAEREVTIDAHVGDIETWISTPGAQGPWDGIVSIFCHLPSAVRAVVADALTPRLSPRGVVIIESYSTGQLSLNTGGPSDEDELLTRERVRQEWGGLVLDIRLKERRIFDGRAHQGLGSFVQVLAHQP